jgi:hemoglobin/transferrin/lactoferrin receptor protein
MVLRITGKKRALLPLLISFSLSNQIVFADEKAVDYERLEKIEVEGVRTVLGGDNINLGDIESINPNDLQVLFRGTPSIQEGNSLPISQKVYVNGIEETNLAVTVDGARQNNKLFHHAGTNLIDPELLKAVRVGSGVGPADTVPGALGGSLAYETKDLSDLLVEGDNFAGAIGLEYNFNGHVFDRNLSLYGRSGGFEALGHIIKSNGE